MRDADRFAGVAAGTLTVIVTVGEASVSATVEEPARLGIFIPKLSPTKPGSCVMTLTLQSGELDERFSISPCTVHANEANARAATVDDEAPGRISFLKEQQWPIAFATEPAKAGTVVPNKTVSAKIIAVPGREAHLTAATAGRVSLLGNAPDLGSPVKKGQVLARIQPAVSIAGNLGSLRADVAAAEAEHAAAQAALARIERLVATDAVPKRRQEEAAAAVNVSRARLNAAKAHLSSFRASASGSASAGAFQVKSPIAGTLVQRSITHGETVTAGTHLFAVIALDRVRVEGRVFEPDLPAFEDPKTAWFTVAGRETVFDINSETGKLITVGHVLDEKSRTAPVIFEVNNPKKVLRIGQYAKLSVGTGAPIEALTIPESAVIQDGNQQTAFVHVSGESFERRVVILGARSRGRVEVRQGVKAGERVVVTGAYDVKLAASNSGATAHGHAH
jgi:RND family efflux transporter MFP subunit